MTKLIYIGGYGRSGSTLLEHLMTGSPDLAACGEVRRLLRADARKRICSCGQSAPDCPIWGVIGDASRNGAQSSHADLDTKLLERLGARYAAVVDSSKTAWRSAITPFRLRRKLGPNFQQVHIVRDPRAVCWSLLQKERRIGARSNHTLRVIKAVVGWSFANLSCELFGGRYPQQYTRVRYEDLAGHPIEAMTPLMAQVLPSSQWDFDAVGTRGNRHQLFANRMRIKELSLESIVLDDKWRDEMPRRFRRLVEWLSGPLRARYGYR